MLSSPAQANHVPMLAAYQGWLKPAHFCILFVLRELETGASGQAFPCVLLHKFAHSQQPKSQFIWKIGCPSMVWTCSCSCRNLPCPEADATWNRWKALNLTGTMSSELNLECSSRDDFKHSSAGHTAKNSEVLLRLNLSHAGSICFRNITATAGIVLTDGGTIFPRHLPILRSLPRGHAVCYSLQCSCLCCCVWSEYLLTFLVITSV